MIDLLLPFLQSPHRQRTGELGEQGRDGGGEHHLRGEILGGQRGGCGIVPHTGIDGHRQFYRIGEAEEGGEQKAQAQTDEPHGQRYAEQQYQLAVQLVEEGSAAGDVGADDDQQSQLGKGTQPLLGFGADALAQQAAEHHGQSCRDYDHDEEIPDHAKGVQLHHGAAQQPQRQRQDHRGEHGIQQDNGQA